MKGTPYSLEWEKFNFDLTSKERVEILFMKTTSDLIIQEISSLFQSQRITSTFLDGTFENSIENFYRILFPIEDSLEYDHLAVGPCKSFFDIIINVRFV